MITIPKSWDDCPLHLGRKIFCISSGLTENEFFEELVKIFDLDLTDKTLDEVTNIKGSLSNLMNFQLSESRLENEYIIGGKRYRMVTDLSLLSYGEFLDLEIILSQCENENYWNNIHLLMAILLKEHKPANRFRTIFGKVKFLPIKYNASNTLKIGEMFDKVLSVQDAYNFASVFFFIELNYLKNSLIFLKDKNQI